MTPSLESIFDYSFVISIDKEREAAFLRRFERAFPNVPRPKLFNGFHLKKGHNKNCGCIITSNVLNCSLSHLAIIKLAKSLNYPHVCVFEDDAVPHVNCQPLLNDTLMQVTDGTDLIQFGWLWHKSGYGLIGSHAYLVFKRYYDQYEINLTSDMLADGNALNSACINKICPQIPAFTQDVFGNAKDTIHDPSVQKYCMEKFNGSADLNIKSYLI